MAGRSNAATELVRFWLEARHGCLLTESVPVAVPYSQSDLDLVAVQATLSPFALPSGLAIGPRVVVECKDHHDWEPTGREFGKLLKADVAMMGASKFVPRSAVGAVTFSMLREAHFEIARRLFDSDDFDRLFVVHVIDQATLAEVDGFLAAHRIHWTTIPLMVDDLRAWYGAHPRPSGMRHTLVGDLWHLLVGFCGMDIPNTSTPP
ncbi:MAG: hypothetical protein AVDCRST_MAG59-2160 [uncultured Thermomicrobiales bacterium]|uniref:Uncharacterized protein n=1 Tax=uncultured Thermomicrobiales bacterium TaxID=1645740 RepID=A0A6J4UTR9_9BACT|nr:MAG: hypothetical protein AVDCRST_MAG59-2160 [uncultured Thermomicrobiales bacterium]